MSFEVSWGLIFTCIRLSVRHQTTGVANMEFRISMETSNFSVFNSNMGRGPDNRRKAIRHTRERAAESQLSPPSLAPPACLFMHSPDPRLGHLHPQLLPHSRGKTPPGLKVYHLLPQAVVEPWGQVTPARSCRPSHPWAPRSESRPGWTSRAPGGHG